MTSMLMIISINNSKKNNIINNEKMKQYENNIRCFDNDVNNNKQKNQDIWLKKCI